MFRSLKKTLGKQHNVFVGLNAGLSFEEYQDQHSFSVIIQSIRLYVVSRTQQLLLEIVCAVMKIHQAAHDRLDT